MDDLISRKGVLLTLTLFRPDQNGYPLNGGIQYARAMIEAAPKMDAKLIEHGRWEWLGPNRLIKDCMCGTCSVCKVRSKYIVNTSLCPNCGAKMNLK